MDKNPVFDLLGAEGDDIEALTAYALYKRHKRAWAKDFEAVEKHPPTPVEDRAFATVASTDDQLERYRKDARDILIAFANQTVNDARADIEKEAVTARIEVAAAGVTKQNSLGKQIFIGILTSAATTGIWLIIALGVRVTGADPISYLNAIVPSGSDRVEGSSNDQTQANDQATSNE